MMMFNRRIIVKLVCIILGLISSVCIGKDMGVNGEMSFIASDSFLTASILVFSILVWAWGIYAFGSTKGWWKSTKYVIPAPYAAVIIGVVYLVLMPFPSGYSLLQMLII